jgi:hypothetical protein
MWQNPVKAAAARAHPRPRPQAGPAQQPFMGAQQHPCRQDHPVAPTLQALDLRLICATCLAAGTASHLATLTSFSVVTSNHIAFMSSLLGVCLGVRHLRRFSWFLAQTSPASRGRTELFGVFLWAAAPAATVILTRALGSEPSLDLDLVGYALARAAISVGHITGIAFFLLRAPLPTRLLPLALVALTWWIPALIPTLAGLLDASPRLASALARQDTCASLAPVGALILAALLLPRPPGTPQ